MTWCGSHYPKTNQAPGHLLKTLQDVCPATNQSTHYSVLIAQQEWLAARDQVHTHYSVHTTVPRTREVPSGYPY